jgi:AbrB family looped-hinge helix DNA binding protein
MCGGEKMIHATSTITGKGQIQLPAEIRKAIGADIGDNVIFIVQDNKEAVLKLIKKKKLSQLGGTLKSQVKFKSIDEETENTKEIWVNKRVRRNNNGENMD